VTVDLDSISGVFVDGAKHGHGSGRSAAVNDAFGLRPNRKLRHRKPLLELLTADYIRNRQAIAA
jgi:hypothetical protein